jgi:hypothetical protein
MVVVLATLLFLRTRQLPEKAEYQFQNCHFLLTNQENASLDNILHRADHSHRPILLERETMRPRQLQRQGPLQQTKPQKHLAILEQPSIQKER